MKKIKLGKMNWKYVNAANSGKKLQAAYDEVFTLARQSLAQKRQAKHISLWMITKDTYDTMKEL